MLIHVSQFSSPSTSLLTRFFDFVSPGKNMYSERRKTRMVPHHENYIINFYYCFLFAAIFFCNQHKAVWQINSRAFFAGRVTFCARKPFIVSIIGKYSALHFQIRFCTKLFVNYWFQFLTKKSVKPLLFNLTVTRSGAWKCQALAARLMTMTPETRERNFSRIIDVNFSCPQKKL